MSYYSASRLTVMTRIMALFGVINDGGMTCKLPEHSLRNERHQQFVERIPSAM